jgi:hypothetical protein
VITEAMVKKALAVYRDNHGWIAECRMERALLAVAPVILEAAAKVAYPDPLYMAGNDRDENGNLSPGSPYDRGRYNAAKDIRALKDPRP